MLFLSYRFAVAMSTWVGAEFTRALFLRYFNNIDSLETGSCQLQLWQLSWRSWLSWQFLRPRDRNRGVIVQLTVWKLGVVSCNFGNSVGKVGEVGGFKLAVSDAPGWK